MITSELKNIIRTETSIDLDNKKTLICRDRDFVEARAIYYKLIRTYLLHLVFLKHQLDKKEYFDY